MKYKEYINNLTPTDRKRYCHIREGNRILGFVVQYETKVGNKWFPVIRYDTAHGMAHKDILDHKGLKKKVLLGNIDYKEALIIADIDIKENWFSYKRQFLMKKT